MLDYALKMMVKDRAKFIGMVFGLTFATFIITQQASIFAGLMKRTYGFLLDTRQPDIWVIDKQVKYLEDIKSFKMSKLYQTRSIEGVEWAAPLYRGAIRARLRSGVFQYCTIVGLDDATLIGAPSIITKGKISNLRMPNAVIVDEVGAKTKLATERNGRIVPLQFGEEFEINDIRAKVVGYCKTVRTFRTAPVVYTTFSRALQFAPKERDLLSFVIVKAKKGVNIEELRRRIERVTGLSAYTSKGLRNLSLKYYITKTGIPINFGVAVILGFVIGIAIAGQTFYTFTHDNLRYFATFKAMGATNKLIAKMIMVQALMTASLGWSFGIGATALFGFMSRGTELAFLLPWWLFVASALAMYFITALAALASLYKIIKLQPSIVFQL